MANVIYPRGIIHALVFCSVFSIFFSCRSNNDVSVTDSDSSGLKRQSDTTPAAISNSPFSNDLHMLYITNLTEDDQLAKLFKPGRSNIERLVFQFHRHKDDYLTLVVIPSILGNQRYYYPDTVIANQSPVISATLPTSSFSFSDLSLFDEPSGRRGLAKLKNHIYDRNNPGHSARWRYILFIPKVVLVGDDAQKAPNHGPYIVYRAIPVSTLPSTFEALQKEEQALTDEENLGDLNPSPPRQVN